MRRASQSRTTSVDQVKLAPLDRRVIMLMHKNINYVSGGLVVAFKQGPVDTERRAWAKILRLVANQLDDGA